MRQTTHDSVGADTRGGDRNLLLGDVTGQPDVAQHITGEEENVLLYVANESAQLRERDVPNVGAVNENSAALRVIEAKQEVDDRGLAGSGVSDKRQRFTWLDFKTHTA